MSAVEAEGEAEEICLLGAAAEAIVWKITEGAGLEIENGERLFSPGGIGAVAAVEENGIATVGRDGSGGGEIVGAAGIAGKFTEDFAVGYLGWRGSGRVLCRER